MFAWKLAFLSQWKMGFNSDLSGDLSILIFFQKFCETFQFSHLIADQNATKSFSFEELNSCQHLRCISGNSMQTEFCALSCEFLFIVANNTNTVCERIERSFVLKLLLINIAHSTYCVKTMHTYALQEYFVFNIH